MICALTIAFSHVVSALTDPMAMLRIVDELRTNAQPGHYVTITNVPPEIASRIRQVFNREKGIGAFYDPKSNEVRIVRLATEN